MNSILGGPSAVIPAAGGAAARRLVAGLLLPAATIALAVAAVTVPAPGGLPAVRAVVAGLVVAWALSGALEARAPERGPQWQVAAGSLAASVAICAGTLADRATAAQHDLARGVAALAGLLVIAISVHLLLALPGGRLDSAARRIGVGICYAAAIGAGIALVAGNVAIPASAPALGWSFALLCTLPAIRLRYATAVSRDRERLQWAAIGGALAGVAALAAAVLHLLVGWPAPVAPVAAAATVLIPLGLVTAGVSRVGRYGGRLLVRVLSTAGFTVVVAVVYLVAVLGLGTPPTDPAGRELLGLSMLAAAIAAIGYVSARKQFADWATRRVFGVRQAPDEILRSFGSRMTRAIDMDELLLQLAETLRMTMRLTRAEVYTGTEGVLERAAAVPDDGPWSIAVGARERPVVAGADVSGYAWASVWLPALLNGRGRCRLRIAPISHAGNLLGLIVAERPAAADPFSTEDDRVLSELARQVGLAVRNARLDTALQTTLDEVRKQADDLRESRARIVASGDAERRRVERDLHDGAQQRLVAMAVTLRLVRDIIAEDPGEAAEMLDQLAEDIMGTIQELRELAHGIYPALLADSGIGEALRAAGSRSPLPVTVYTDGLGRYSAEVEAAVYFCCLEALQNAAKHAQGARVEVRVWQESGGLLFSVSDDGPGFHSESARSGHGFVNMADRLGAIGGTIRWESQPSQGCYVLGSVPML
jgi:signal transduction histidine kinase